MKSYDFFRVYYLNKNNMRNTISGIALIFRELIPQTCPLALLLDWFRHHFNIK